jgi:sialate O-acetylesterase
MVLQQQTKAKLWGWARNGAKIDVTVSWNKEIYTAKADKAGRWEVFVDTPTASFVP